MTLDVLPLSPSPVTTAPAQRPTLDLCQPAVFATALTAHSDHGRVCDCPSQLVRTYDAVMVAKRRASVPDGVKVKSVMSRSKPVVVDRGYVAGVVGMGLTSGTLLGGLGALFGAVLDAAFTAGSSEFAGGAVGAGIGASLGFAAIVGLVREELRIVRNPASVVWGSEIVSPTLAAMLHYFHKQSSDALFHLEQTGRKREARLLGQRRDAHLFALATYARDAAKLDRHLTAVAAAGTVAETDQPIVDRAWRARAEAYAGLEREARALQQLCADAADPADAGDAGDAGDDSTPARPDAVAGLYAMSLEIDDLQVGAPRAALPS